jgi:anthrone oxygenase-like protein
MSWRARLTRMLLWISVLTWGILLGAKVFDLRVVVGSWSASPPESLSLLPYGPRYPVDTGQFFIPISVAVLLASFGALISGWKTPPRYRMWLVLSAAMILVCLIFTVVAFWPRNSALWAVANRSPTAIQDPAEVLRMVREWVTYDWLRVAMATVGFGSSVRAISVPIPAPDDLRAAQGER